MIVEVCNNKEGRNLNCRRLRGKLGVSSTTAFCILKKNEFQSVKKLTKPGLTEDMKKAWLNFCKAYKY
jgi:hypothetical protein